MTNDDTATRLNPDLMPWERQPDETDMAYTAFEAYLHSDKRKVTDHGPSARNWSMKYLWAYRAQEYDIYMSRIDLEEQVRYRRRMNARQRQIGSVGQAKVVGWLNALDDDKVAAMSPADATRLLDVAVRIERAATVGADVEVKDLPAPYTEEPSSSKPSFLERLHERLQEAGLEAGIQVEMSDLAEFIYRMMRDPVPPWRPATNQPPAVKPEPPATPPEPDRHDVFSSRYSPFGGANVPPPEPRFRPGEF